MIEEIVRFALTSLVSSVCFLGCHTITSYVADPRQLITTRPHIMSKHPWLGNATGFLSFLVFLLVILNGWLIWSWIGMILLPLFWFIVMNPLVTRSTIFNDPFNDPNIRNNPEIWETINSHTSSFKILTVTSNPFVQVTVGTPVLIVITIVNVILR